jgi:hypothetical protein
MQRINTEGTPASGTTATPNRAARRHLGRISTASALCAGSLLLGAAAAGACTTAEKNGGDSHPVLTAAHFDGELAGTVGSVGSSSFTLAGRDGTSWTVDVGPSTTFEQADQASSLASLSTGEKVKVMGSVLAGSPNTFTATKVIVVLAHLEGSVVSVTSGSFIVSDGHGFWRVVDESAATTYSTAPATPVSVTASSVVPGVRVEVSGLVDANHTSLDATSVRIELSKVLGTVTSVSGANFALAGFGGGTASITTSASTVFRTEGAEASLASVVVGAKVAAFGSTESDGTLAASVVEVKSNISHPVPLKAFGHHHAGHHGDQQS